MQHLKHSFIKINDKFYCEICQLERSNYYQVPLYKRNNIDYASLEPKCINIELLNYNYYNQLN